MILGYPTTPTWVIGKIVPCFYPGSFAIHVSSPIFTAFCSATDWREFTVSLTWDRPVYPFEYDIRHGE